MGLLRYSGLAVGEFLDMPLLVTFCAKMNAPSRLLDWKKRGGTIETSLSSQLVGFDCAVELSWIRGESKGKES
jgi:hypothetical protein